MELPALLFSATDFFSYHHSEEFMIRTTLYAADGTTIVAIVSVPPFPSPAAVIVWGSRYFVRTDTGNYREGLAYHARVHRTDRIKADPLHPPATLRIDTAQTI